MREGYAILPFLVCAALTLCGAQGAAAASPTSQAAWTGLDFTAARTIPVQYGGRTMPLDTLARQIIWQVTGRRSWQGYEPLGLLLAWTWQGQDWLQQPVVLVGFPALQKQIGLSEDQKHFSYTELMGNERLMRMASGDGENAELPAARRAAQQIVSRLEVLQNAFTGRLMRIVPPPGDESAAWMTVQELGSRIAGADAARLRSAMEKMQAGFVAGKAATFEAGTRELVDAVRGIDAAAQPDRSVLSLEVRYNQLRPFQWGWILTCLAMVAGLVSLATPNRVVRGAAWVLLVAGFAALTAGIVMRWRFSGHAPLATMYESLIFMGWGATAIGIVTAAIVGLRAALPMMAGVATAILIVADSTPLDAMASPLVPVLRNTMWLTYHVLTIMLAYSALALATGVGHVQAATLAYRRGDTERAARLGRLLYGMILVGCVFLTAGIIFGAIWANKSWGRYWGWDPKETWSLITLLGYMTVLHGRRVNWFGSFGLAAAAIVCFQLVVMTYYGVNFVLGTGLHSYGFATGGQIWVGLYVAGEIIFVLWTWAAYSSAAQGASAEKGPIVGRR
jgi:ABC-type transport system involved in cytochrome c biogenesis permease subunit